MNLPPVIADDLDPRLRLTLSTTPNGVRVIFAGPDPTFIAALIKIYGCALASPDVLVVQTRGRILVTIALTEHADGLLVDLVPCIDGTYGVTPLLLFTPGRAGGVKTRLRQPPGFADLTIVAFEDLIFRRVMSTGAAQ
jgi:hypothetical protein